VVCGETGASSVSVRVWPVVHELQPTRSRSCRQRQCCEGERERAEHRRKAGCGDTAILCVRFGAYGHSIEARGLEQNRAAAWRGTTCDLCPSIRGSSPASTRQGAGGGSLPGPIWLRPASTRSTGIRRRAQRSLSRPSHHNPLVRTPPIHQRAGSRFASASPTIRIWLALRSM
jgi:hypothetical protein